MKCYVCKKEEETRPYGVNAQPICFDCSQSSPERKAECERQMAKRFEGDGPFVLTKNGPVSIAARKN